MSFPHSILNLSKQQLQKHIREESKNTANVAFTKHAQLRMKERHITSPMIFETLRKGKINLMPEINYSKGNIECRMEYFVAGKDVKVVVAVCDENPLLMLITAI